MPWASGELPFAASPSSLAGHCSHQGAVAAEGRAATQTLRYLELLAKCGPLTDWDASKRLDIQRSTINARRAPLCARGIVVAVDKVKNDDTSTVNTRWGLAQR